MCTPRFLAFYHVRFTRSYRSPGTGGRFVGSFGGSWMVLCASPYDILLIYILTIYSLYIKYVCVLLLSSVSFRFACSFTIRFAAQGFCLRARFLQRRIQTIPSPVFSVASLLLYAAALAQRERDANAGSQ